MRVASVDLPDFQLCYNLQRKARVSILRVREMSEFEPVIGLEVHAQILTQSKMFCDCSADFFGAAPNTHVCPVCLGMPGTLPVINQAAVEATIRTALALHCEIPPYAKFDRKNYHYPDLMKGYQISQYDLPLSRNGYLTIETEGGNKRIGIRRVHLEEDTAKSFHVDDSSLIDVNRAGVPLMEIVSEPDLHSLDDVKQYSENLRQVLRYLGVSSGDMEKGAMRFEANISLRWEGSSELSKTRVEIKNLNSFRAMLRGVEYEIKRQEKILNAGGVVEQETMGWDDVHNTTIPQRSKEEANDYRYFPEPDLPRLEISRTWVEQIRASLPELPDEKIKRYISELKLTPYDAGVITAEKDIADYYDRAVQVAGPLGVEPKTIANWLTSDLFGLHKNANIEILDSPVSSAHLVELLALINKGTISTTIAKNVLSIMFETGRGAADIVAERGLAVVTDQSAIDSLVDKVIAANPDPVMQFKNGKTGALQFIIGQVMKESKGKAKPDLVRDVVIEKLKQHNGV